MVCSLHPTTAAAKSGLSYQGTAADISQQLAFSTLGSNQEYDLCLHTYPLCRLLCAVSKCNCYRMDGYRETLKQLMQVHIAKILRVCSVLVCRRVVFHFRCLPFRQKYNIIVFIEMDLSIQDRNKYMHRTSCGNLSALIYVK